MQGRDFGRSALICSAVFVLAACSSGSGFTPSAGLTNQLQALPSKAGARAAIVPKNIVVGGFDEQRGGQQSLEDQAVSGLKAAIVSGFPGVTFKFARRLTPKFFRGVDIVFLGVGKSATSGITPLSGAEQHALHAYFESNGAAVIFTDNDTFDSNAIQQNDSLLTPFGMSAKGTLDGNQTANFLHKLNPIQHGPFGSVTEIDTFFPGWFVRLGQCVDFAAYASNGKPAACYFPRHQRRGTATLFSDSSMVFDANRTPNDQTAILNALALAQ